MTDSQEEKLDAAITSHAEWLGAITMILLSKGVCTAEEIESAKITASAQFDQLVAAVRDGSIYACDVEGTIKSVEPRR